MPEPRNANGYPLGEDLRETMASALGLDVDEGWLSIAITLMEQSPTSDGPRVWSLPAEPGPEVTAVRDAQGRVWERIPWPYREDGSAGEALSMWKNVNSTRTRWKGLIHAFGPLVDATEER